MIIGMDRLSEEVREYLDDGDWLRRRYVEERASPTEIGKELGCSATSVKRFILKHGIEVRSISEAMKVKRPAERRRLGDARWLREMYVDRGLSTTEMGRLMGCSGGAVLNALEEQGIPRRPAIDAIRVSKRMNEDAAAKLENETWMREAYLGQQRSVCRIAAELDVSERTVLNWINHHQLPVRSVREAHLVRGRAAINGYEVQRLNRLKGLAKDAGAVGKAYTQVRRILGELDKVPYTSRENSQLEGEAMDGLHKAEDALAQRLFAGSEN
jgi:hypothetical protein